MSVTDAAASGLPVALLGRSGLARERMRAALVEVGAIVVLEDDPQAISAQMLCDAGPVAVLVVLEPGIEDALDALEPALSAPGLMVIFDEAELAAHREGWYAQRWTRHLAAKLYGHDQVLPAGTEAEPEQTSISPRLAPSQPSSAEAAADVSITAASVLGDSNTWELIEVAIEPSQHVEHDFSQLATGDLALVAIDQDTHRADGVVLVIAGIGGPDAIRRLLAALPSQFPRAVLVKMALDGAQYPNLVLQVGRVSALPVELGEAGRPLRAGTVYVLPEAVALAEHRGELVFAAGVDSALLPSVVPVDDSAVLLLSGADPALVEPVLALAAAGAWVAGQANEGCYDPAAASQLARHGLLAAEPAQLAHALAERWPVAQVDCGESQ